MGERKTVLILLMLLALLVAAPEIKVSTADSRTLVVPDDYPTISSAIGNATDGDTVFVKKGTYDGPINQTLVINQTIALIGEDPETTILNMRPRWIPESFPMNPYPGYDESIEILANDVEISGFTIKGNGQILNEGSNLQVKSNIIKLCLFLSGSREFVYQNNFTTSPQVYSGHSTFASNNFINCGFGLHSLASPYCTAYDNVVTNSTGISSSGNGNIIFNNTVTDCKHGLFIGTYARNNVAYGNILTNNVIGIRVQSENSNNTLYSNYVANNSYGVAVMNDDQVGDRNILYRNNFVNNTEQVNTDTIVLLDEGSEWKASHGGTFDNGEEGNYWSDYTGVDSDGDGIGDTPYVIDANRTDNYPLMQPVAIPLLQPPEISILSLQNITYATDSVSLNFTTNKEISWMGYSLDGEDNVTLTENTVTLTGLTNGVHNLTVYASDTAGNNGTSETFTFTVAKEPDPTQVTLTTIALAVAIAAVASIAAIRHYLKNRPAKHI